MSRGRAAALALTAILGAALLVAAALAGGGDRGAAAWLGSAPRALRGEGAAQAAVRNKTAEPPSLVAHGIVKPQQQQQQQQPQSHQPPKPQQLQQQHQQQQVPEDAAAGKNRHIGTLGANGTAVGKNATAVVGKRGASGQKESKDVAGLWRGVNAGCVAVRGGKLLVVRQNSGAWSLPGGTGEHGENSRRTAERETYEETGYRVSAGGLVTVWGNGFRIYRCSVHGGTGGSKDHHEVRAFGWRSAGEIRRMRWRFPGQARRYPSWMR